MHSLHPRAYFLAMALSALAGYVDVIGFLQLGGYFISFMSGNSTRLAIGLSNPSLTDVPLIAAILACFVLGSMLGTLVRHLRLFFAPQLSPITLVLGLVTLLLLMAAGAYHADWQMLAITCMVLAMGAENAVFQRNGDVVIGLTYMTGTLVKIGQYLATALRGGAAALWVPYLLLWLGLILGGVTGAILFHGMGLNSLWIAVSWAGFLAVIAEWKKEVLSAHDVSRK